MRHASISSSGRRAATAARKSDKPSAGGGGLPESEGSAAADADVSAKGNAARREQREYVRLFGNVISDDNARAMLGADPARPETHESIAKDVHRVVSHVFDNAVRDIRRRKRGTLDRAIEAFCFNRPMQAADMMALAASGEVTEDEIYEAGYRWHYTTRCWVVTPEARGKPFTPNGRYFAPDGKWHDTRRDGGRRFAVRSFADGTKFVEVDNVPEEIINETDANKLKEKVAILIKNRWGNDIIDPAGVRVFVNDKTADEYTHPAKRRKVPASVFRAKMDASGNLDEIVSASSNPRIVQDGQNGHIHPNVKEWEHRDAIFLVNGRFYNCVINIAILEKVRSWSNIRTPTQNRPKAYLSNERTPKAASK